MEGSQRSALLEVYAQVSSCDRSNGSGEQSFVFVTSSQVCDLKAEDSSISLNSENGEGKTLTVKEIFEEENRNFIETDQAQKPKNHTVSTFHGREGRNGVSSSQEDTNQLEHDLEEKDQHSGQFSAGTEDSTEVNKVDSEEVVQEQKNQVTGQTPEVPEDLQEGQ